MNIIHIHTDSQDGRVLGCAGLAAAHTPNLDRLAAEGVHFVNAYCNSPECVPSRSSMLTGQYTHHCEAWNNYDGIQPDTPTYDMLFAKSGYRTVNVGRQDHLAGRHTPRARVDAWTRTAGIDRPAYNEPAPVVIDKDKPRVSATDWQRVDEAIEWLQTHGKSGEKDPFKLYVGFGAPHPPFVTSRTYWDLIDPERITMPSLEEPAHPVARFQSRHKNWPYGFSEEMVRKVRRIYCAMVAEVDAMVGRLMNTVSSLGLDDSTVIVVSSDHGELAMEHRQYYKMSPYEGSMRVPLLVRGPGVPRGKRVESPVSLVDLYPTFTDVACIPRPAGLDGHSLAGMLGRPAEEHPGWAMGQFHSCSTNASWFMLREGDWKYNAYVGFEPELFDLRTDPEELRNMAGNEPERVKAMDQRLRSIVDVDEVAARVKAHDKASFRAWRAEEQARGTYSDSMAKIFSGFDDLPPEKIMPWTEKDEGRITEWLGE